MSFFNELGSAIINTFTTLNTCRNIQNDFENRRNANEECNTYKVSKPKGLTKEELNILKKHYEKIIERVKRRLKDKEIVYLSYRNIEKMKKLGYIKYKNGEIYNDFGTPAWNYTYFCDKKVVT